MARSSCAESLPALGMSRSMTYLGIWPNLPRSGLVLTSAGPCPIPPATGLVDGNPAGDHGSLLSLAAWLLFRSAPPAHLRFAQGGSVHRHAGPPLPVPVLGVPVGWMLHLSPPQAP